MTRKKLSKKSNATPLKVAAEKVEAMSAVVTVPKTSVTSPPVYTSPPDPRALFYEAEQEPDYRALSEYTGVIGKLREKGFSYREIAGWLSERGVDADFNAVYRVYTSGLSDQEAAVEAEQEEQDERRHG